MLNLSLDLVHEGVLFFNYMSKTSNMAALVIKKIVLGSKNATF